MPEAQAAQPKPDNEGNLPQLPLHSHTLEVGADFALPRDSQKVISATLLGYDTFHRLVQNLPDLPEVIDPENPSPKDLVESVTTLVSLTRAIGRIREMDDYLHMAPRKLNVGVQLEAIIDIAQEFFPIPEDINQEWRAAWSKKKQQIRIMRWDEDTHNVINGEMTMNMLEEEAHNRLNSLIGESEKKKLKPFAGNSVVSLRTKEDLRRYQEVVNLALHDVINPLSLVDGYVLGIQDVPVDDEETRQMMAGNIRTYMEVLREATMTGQELLELRFETLSYEDIVNTLTSELKPLDNMDIAGQRLQIEIRNNVTDVNSAFFSSGLIKAFARGTADDARKGMLKRNKMVEEKQLPAERLQEQPFVVYSLEKVVTDTGTYLVLIARDNGGGIPSSVVDSNHHFIKRKSDWGGAASGHGIGNSIIHTIANTEKGFVTGTNWEQGAEVALWILLEQPSIQVGTSR